jgi:hypothetical protein
VILVGLPLVVLPSPVVAIAAVPAAILCAAGVGTLARPVVTAGAVFAVIEYALAVWRAGTSPDFVIAIAFGVVLLLMLEVIDFAARLDGVAVGTAVIASQARSWIARAAGSAGVSLATILAAVGMSPAIGRVAHPAASLIAPIGVVLTTLGVAMLLLPSRRTTK